MVADSSESFSSRSSVGKATVRQPISSAAVPLPTTLMATKANPLPLDKTLRDLALLTSCDIDLSILIPNTSTMATEEHSDVDSTVARSYEFVREARAAQGILNREQVEKQDGRVEEIRNTLDDVAQGLGAASSQ
ncbi:hypothetical protein BC835DRAFT_1350041 [Cytidiella melzeri]|nr:hypothetical protein BC835DRAFT_1350029 [Cytidiella melzeri]KAI0694358.1 hypothetical protein BC835DRAFT_1350041 [Cytidiella melzeri]